MLRDETIRLCGYLSVHDVGTSLFNVQDREHTKSGENGERFIFEAPF